MAVSIVPADRSVAVTAQTSSPQVNKSPSKKRNSAKGPKSTTPMPPTPSASAPAGEHTASPMPKRRKSRGPTHSDTGFNNPLDLRTPMWQTIVAFRTSFGKGFNRVLDSTFSLASARKAVEDKYHLAAGTPISLSYQAGDGMRIDLDDSEDIRAFQVFASREPSVTVHVDFPESSIGTSAGSASTPSQEPAATPSKTSRGRRGKSKGTSTSATPSVPPVTAEPMPEPSSETAAAPTSHVADSSVAEVARLTDPNEPPAAAPSVASTPKSSRKRKAKETPAEQSTVAAVHEEPAQLNAAHDEDEDDEDIPLSQSAPPSSQSMPPPSQDTDKPKRHRRTKAEMEAFRAEQAAKKLEKEQAKQGHQPVPAAADDDVPDTTNAGDETTIVHDVRTDEHASAAAAAVQVLMAEGSVAMQQRLNDLKAKKQRKNATEREEQKLLVSLVGKDGAASQEASTREYSR